MLKPGMRLGPYELVGPIGRGGMGEVHRARDTRLGRDVAIKVLSPDLAGDPQALARFEREGRAVAALSHPNIVALYDVGRADDVVYAVTELLQGQTLRERLKEGAVAPRKAIEYVRAVADAAAAAHGRGIVHRDLKPENVFVTTDGRVKVLDFGIAQMSPAVPGDPSHTRSDLATTGSGAIVGTVGYMAPEQVRGSLIDARTDVFAIGVLLYELLTGVAAFARDTPADTVTAVLTADPPELPRIAATAGPPVEYIVRRSVEKNPDERFQSARDLAFALEALTSGTAVKDEAVIGATRPSAMPRLVAFAAAAVAAVAASAGAFIVGRRAAAEPRPTPSVLFSIPASTAPFDAASVSPDGRSIAFTGATVISSSATGVGVSIRRLDSAEVTTLSETGAAIPPFVWSPDSRMFGYFINNELIVRELPNGAPRTLAGFPGRATGASWGSRGVILVGTAAGLYRIPESGGAAQIVMKTVRPEVWRSLPSFLPDGQRFVYSALRNGNSETGLETRVASLDGRELGTLLSGAVGAMYADGHLLFGLNGALQAQPFDLSSLRLTGTAKQIASAVSQNWRTGDIAARASETGVIVFRTAPDSDAQFTWLDRAGRRLGTVGAPDAYTNFDVSPDGRRIAANRRDPRTGVNSLALIDVERGVTTPITPRDEDGFDDPTWAPDGRHLAYRHGDKLVMRIADGGEERTLVPGEAYPDHFTRDGRFITFGRQRAGLYEAWALDIQTAGANPIALVPNVTLSDETRFSRNEKWVAYHSDESGADQVWVIPFPPTGEKWQISQNGGVQPRWASDGNELFFLAPDGRLMAVSIPDGDPRRAGEPRALFLTGLTPSNALDQFAVVGDRFLMRLPASARTTASSPIQVLVNWATR